MVHENDFLILGAGVCGMAAASVLGERVTVLERGKRPGGLVLTHRLGDYWFDRVIHLLHFRDDHRLQERIQALMGEVLKPCPPVAWVETAAGVARYPIQNNLSDLKPAFAQRCVNDLLKENESHNTKHVRNYEDFLLRTFGRSLCELFFFPYNRKTWRRPLSQLVPSGFQWNIARPDINSTIGAQHRRSSAHNHNCWYPRPGRDAPLRGMEILSQCLASQCADLRLGHEVISIDAAARTVGARHAGKDLIFRYRKALLSTLPLPHAIRACQQAPKWLKAACIELPYIRVRSVALCIEGTYPNKPGHYRYFTDDSLPFTRLVFMNEFDPCMSPTSGWGLLAEVTEPGESAALPESDLIKRVWQAVERLGILSSGSRLIDAGVFNIAPAYVVFTPESQPVVEQARKFLKSYDIEPLGRYGYWEYSSMAQVMMKGFEWAESRSSG